VNTPSSALCAYVGVSRKGSCSCASPQRWRAKVHLLGAVHALLGRAHGAWHLQRARAALRDGRGPAHRLPAHP
jgi:hypothetical protein